MTAKTLSAAPDLLRADRMLQSATRAPASEMHFHSFFSLPVIAVHWTCYRPQALFLPLGVSSQPDRPSFKKSFESFFPAESFFLFGDRLLRIKILKTRYELQIDIKLNLLHKCVINKCLINSFHSFSRYYVCEVTVRHSHMLTRTAKLLTVSSPFIK
jgi:hypothetical protein